MALQLTGPTVMESNFLVPNATFFVELAAFALLFFINLAFMALFVFVLA
jgi:hypothetical protein